MTLVLNIKIRYRISSPISLVIFSVSDTEFWRFFMRNAVCLIAKGLGFKNNS